MVRFLSRAAYRGVAQLAEAREKTYLDNGGVSQAALSTVLKTVGTVMSGMGLDTSLRRHNDSSANQM